MARWGLQTYRLFNLLRHSNSYVFATKLISACQSVATAVETVISRKAISFNDTRRVYRLYFKAHVTPTNTKHVAVFSLHAAEKVRKLYKTMLTLCGFYIVFNCILLSVILCSNDLPYWHIIIGLLTEVSYIRVIYTGRVRFVSTISRGWQDVVDKRVHTRRFDFWTRSARKIIVTRKILFTTATV